MMPLESWFQENFLLPCLEVQCFPGLLSLCSTCGVELRTEHTGPWRHFLTTSQTGCALVLSWCYNFPYPLDGTGVVAELSCNIALCRVGILCPCPEKCEKWKRSQLERSFLVWSTWPYLLAPVSFHAGSQLLLDSWRFLTVFCLFVRRLNCYFCITSRVRLEGGNQEHMLVWYLVGMEDTICLNYLFVSMFPTTVNSLRLGIISYTLAWFMVQTWCLVNDYWKSIISEGSLLKMYQYSTLLML